MSIYKSNYNQTPSSEKYAKYAESLKNESDGRGTGFAPGYTAQEAIRNNNLHNIQKQMMQQQMQQLQQMQMMQNPFSHMQSPMMQPQGLVLPPPPMGTPVGYIGGRPYNPYNLK